MAAKRASSGTDEEYNRQLRDIDAVDIINHPPHYNDHPSGVECIDIVEHFNFNIGNAIKYLWRAGLKLGSSEQSDVLKAQWYINREVERRDRFAVRTDSPDSNVARDPKVQLPFGPGALAD